MKYTNLTRMGRAGRWGLCGLALLTLCSCAMLSGGPVRGRVFDADTGKPVTDAIAYGIWDGELTGLTPRTVENCIWAESSKVDDQGRFDLPFWSVFGTEALLTSGSQQSIFVYAPGYVLTLLHPGDLPNVRVKRFVGTVDERFAWLKISPCIPVGSEHVFAGVYRRMADEMEGLAVTDLQHEQARSARSAAEAARTDRSKPATQDGFGRWINVDPNDRYPE